MNQWLQRLRANARDGAVSDATIQGYLRAASQIEEVWQRIDDKVNELILQGLPPWEAYTALGYALAFVRASRMNILFVQGLLQAEETGGTASAGRLPKITYDQALALCEHIEPTVEEAIKAVTNPRYTLPSSTLPLVLGPRVSNGYQSLPLSHLRGMVGAAQEMKDWTSGLLAQYELALYAAKETIPPQVSAHLEQMKGELELGNFHLRAGTDMLGQFSQDQIAEELGKKADGLLWKAMESFYKVSQLIALPGVRRRAGQSTPVEPLQRQSSPQPAPRQAEQEAQTPQQPDINSLMNQVTAGRGPVQSAPSQPSTEVISLLNQLSAAPPTRGSPSSQTAPDASGLLSQEAATPVSNAPDTSNVLNWNPGLQASSRSPARTAGTSSRDTHARGTTAEENTLDLFAEICNEQKETHE